MQEKYQWAQSQRDRGLPTIPSTILEELIYNPFMRVDQDVIRDAVGLPHGSPVEVMHALRELKNQS